jgi:hypothetical protein
LRDLLADWQQHGAEIIRQVAREQPGTYLKVMAMLMPKEHRVESAHTVIGSLPDEQLHAMIGELQERIAKKLEQGKVINGEAAEIAALPPPVPGRPWRPRRTRKAAKALKAITADCEIKDHSFTSPSKEPLK